jgi:hypothetical protein
MRYGGLAYVGVLAISRDRGVTEHQQFRSAAACATPLVSSRGVRVPKPLRPLQDHNLAVKLATVALWR